MKKLYKNGNVYLPNKSRATSFVVEDDKFAYVGDLEGAKAYSDCFDEECDLNGKLVLPGFNDSHLHLISTGNSLNMVDLYDATSVEELIEKGKEFIGDKKFDKDHFVIGFGWNQDYFDEKIFPTRYDLDKISTEYPICYIRVCYHIYVANSKALELAGIDKDTPQVEGGHFDVDENGIPLGIFREAACELITSKITPLNNEEIKKCILDGVELCNSKGITSIGTDDLSEFSNVPFENIIGAFTELEEKGQLNARINQQCRFGKYKDFERFLDQGYRTGSGENLFKIGPLKMFADGSLGARTAFLNDPYSDDESTCGVPVLTQEEIDKWVKKAHEERMQVAIHGIGDGAMYRIIAGYEKALKGIPRNDHRHGIVHAQILDKYILDKMKELGLIAYVQTIFLDYDCAIVMDRLGEKRANQSYAFKTMRDAGIRIANGSDAPVEWPCVFKGMQNGITRASLAEPTKPYLIEEALSLDSIIETYTSEGAFATFEENIKGTIEKGKLADFVIMEDDLFQMKKEEIHTAKVKETYLGGQCVWKNEG